MPTATPLKHATMERSKLCTHTDRWIYAKGLCWNCYRRHWLNTGPFNIPAKCHPDRRNYAKNMCRQCYDSYVQKKHRNENNERFYENILKRLYGISYTDYQRMYAEQQGKCKICQKPPKHEFPKKGGLEVDHCHVTGVIRGLLCRSCNVLVGWVDRKNPEFLERILDYINNARQKSC